MAKKTTSSAPKTPAPSPSAKLPKPKDSEVEAYDFIRRQLKDLGWVVKDPNRGAGGQVWTQNQCLSHPHLKAAFGLKRPENVIKVSETHVWVIEAKALRAQLDQAVDEAVKVYADEVNRVDLGTTALLATGVAGNENAGYLVRTMVWLDGSWHIVTINNKEATGLLSPEDIRNLMDSGSEDIHEFTPPQWLFALAAERINEYLHSGGINKNDRAKTMAALLLSVIDEPPNLETSLPVMIAEINARSEAQLKDNNKLDFAPFVRLLAPVGKTSHSKFKHALVKVIQELQNLNIRSAMKSSTDVLGQFYEVFLKYGNGAKEIGIVLTPRHITRFAVEAIGVSPRDIVLDPACGTGGFLVAAFDHVRRNANSTQLERFKEHNLFGIEQESYVAVLAIVNMIFRGDGKNNIVEGNSFSTYLTAHSIDSHPSAKFASKAPEKDEEPATRVLMNPPFALARSTEKEHRFVSHALSLMQDGGLLFALVPLDTMFGAGEEKVWRKDELLRSHTLLSVVTMPDELFYPAAQKQVAGVIIRKGVPHPVNQPVFWARIERDGHLKLKSKRMPASEMRPPRSELDDLPAVLPALQSFMANPNAARVNIAKLYKTAPIDYDDPLLELLPEAYLDSDVPTEESLTKAVAEMVRETAAFLVRANLEGRAEDFDEDD